MIMPVELSRHAGWRNSDHLVTIAFAQDIAGIDTAAQYRPNEIRGVRYEDKNGNQRRDASELGLSGKTVYIDLDRDNAHDAGEPITTTGIDGSYAFTGMNPGAYVIREVEDEGYHQTYPQKKGGILWPTGVSNPAVGNVTPTSITTVLDVGQSYRRDVSITLPNSGGVTNMVDVFLLFDDTGSFVNNSPIVRAAFPEIMTQLQTALPGINLGFGVGRMEEYANFASEYATGRPFTLNQSIVSAATTNYLTSIQAALNRVAPGYGGDQPETDIEALFQLVTGRGFDGNNNGTTTDSGAAGLASTQLTPGASGDVPAFSTFTADAANNVLAPQGTLGGAGFRAGALPIVLLATDTGFAYQPKGETSITGVGGLTLPLSALTNTSRATTPFSSGAGIQETITGLNALGALVIGLGTNPLDTTAPRSTLEAISKLTGAINRTTTSIANGTTNDIAPGDPLYFQIASGFSSSVSNGVVNAIQNAVTTVAMDITVQASDPRVQIINHSGTRTNVGAGQTATFDIEIVGDGKPHRFDLQFVRAGTNVVLGSIPVVIGTNILGDGYEYDDLDDGEIEDDDHFGSQHEGLHDKYLDVVSGSDSDHENTFAVPRTGNSGPRPGGTTSGRVVLDNRSSSGGAGTNPLKIGSRDNYTAPPASQSTSEFAWLDLKNNDLVLYYNTPTEGTNLLKNIDLYVKNTFDKINNGTNTGTAKITSSMWAADPQSYTLAVANNAELNLSAYDSVDGGTNSNQIIVKFTFAGDMNLDGLVNAADYGVVDGGILAGMNSGATYASGDSNYDGAVNAGDYAVIDGSILAGFDSGTPLNAVDASGSSITPLGVVDSSSSSTPIAAPALSSSTPLGLSAAVAISSTTAPHTTATAPTASTTTDPSLTSGICQTTTVAVVSSLSSKHTALRHPAHSNQPCARP